ncbi:FAD-dependent oxidoreductase, partial [Chloroflexota bacterium]
EAKQLSRMLEKAGADALHVSGMGFGDYLGYTTAIMYDPPANLTHLAEAVKKEASIPVIAVGKISLQDGERLLQEGKADLIAIGRSLLTDPDLPNKAAEGKFEDIRPCLWCRVCGDIMLHIKRSGIRCVVNAALGHEREYDITPAERRRRILVIGGGPGGMEAARVAALRGHEVTLCEREPELGGQMLLAALPPCKDPIRDFTNYLIGQIKKSLVHVELGKEVDVSLIKSMKPDVVVLATGGTLLTPRIPGHDSSNVVTAKDVLIRNADLGIKVVVIGGGAIGCETADFLSEDGKEVTVLEMLPEFAITLGSSMRARLLARLARKKVRMMARVNVREISNGGVDIVDSDWQRQSVECDTVVLAIGFEANRSLSEELGHEGIEAYLVGDCVEPRDIMEAVADGFRVARSL